MRREQLAVVVALALLTAAAWALTLFQMSSMAGGGRSAELGSSMGSAATTAHGSMAGPSGMGDLAMGESGGVEPGPRLLVYLGIWVTMMAAMMLPAAAPMILMFGTIYRSKRQKGRAFIPTWLCGAGYLAVWAAFGASAWGLGEVGEGLVQAYPMLGDLSPRLAALAMLGAGLYQLTPLKERCLSQCRSPLSFVMQRWRDGIGGALRMGAEHGIYCVGCCWVLFVLLVVVGLASLPWMGLITLIVCAEKLLPRGRLVTLTVAIGLVSLGLLTLARPNLLAPTLG
jgi:predicted metal-binding membrane protein